jgi:sugar-specific transcriptional regulator TrmB
MTDREGSDALSVLDLTEYEAATLEALLAQGRTTAPDLVEATDVPQARIYTVLDGLADRGFVTVYPGRPKEYEPHAPEEILDRAIANSRDEHAAFEREVESARESFLAEFRPLYEGASDEVAPAEDLFSVVDVGEQSERETRALYRAADERIDVLTKSFEYLEAVRPALSEALDSGVDVRVLLLHPDRLGAENRATQVERIETLREDFPGATLRFSEGPMPWRGTAVDPSMDYESGRAILLVEERDIPLHKRQAIVTENGSFVAGPGRYVDLLCAYECVAADSDSSASSASSS